MNNQNFLLDKDFLKKLDVQQRREVYARITSLSFDEQPIEQIEGLITTGSVNVDGASSIRRTCSLTMISDQLNIKDYNWALKTKFKLEIGIRNTINNTYPDVCWFPLGLYVITSFTTSISLNNRTISIQGKDKMCLLNGDLGGSLPASIDFGKEETYIYHYLYQKVSSSAQLELNTYYIYNEETLEYELAPSSYDPSINYYIREKDSQGKDAQFLEYKYLPLTTIIREGVHAWGQEPYDNIIIKDLDTYGLEQLTYKGDTIIWVFYNTVTKQIQVTSTPATGAVYQLKDGDESIGNPITFENLISGDFQYDTELVGDGTQFQITSDEHPQNKTLNKLEYGNDIGYRITDLIYNSDLISSVGEAFTSILDKIKNMLSDFEYFYNLDGQFVFQRKKTYVNVSWSAIDPSDIQNINVNPTLTKITYDFSDKYLISAFNKNPTLNNLKNDYSIWGERQTVSGAKIPIHARYSIHNKPIYYKTLDGTIYTTDDELYNEAVEAAGSSTATSGLTPAQQTTFNNQLSTYKNNILTFFNNTSNFKTPKFPGLFNISGYQEDTTYINTHDNREYVGAHNFTLPAAWWDLEDWNKFYKIVTGHYATESIYQYHNHDINNTYSTAEFYYPGKLLNKQYPAYAIQELTVSAVQENTSLSNHDKTWLMLAGDIDNNIDSYTIFLFKPSSNSVGDIYEDIYNNNIYTSTQKTDPVRHQFFDSPAIATMYHVSDSMTIQSLINSNYRWYIQSTESGYQRTKITDPNKTLNFRVYIYNPQISPADGNSIIDALKKRIFREQGWVISHKLPAYKVDWREIIYQMSLDYFANNSNEKQYNDTVFTYADKFLERIKQNNFDFYPTGHTGYEMYYTDIKSFWRELYNPNLSETVVINNNIGTSEYYWTEEDKTITEADNEQYGITLDVSIDENRAYWNKKVFLEPTSLNFWLDFLDSGQLMQYAVPLIGLRTKALTNNKLQSVYYKAIPNFIFYLGDKAEHWKDFDPQQQLDKSGYTFISLPRGFQNSFSVSSRYYSIQDEMNNLLYQFSYVPENITLTSLPIYYLEPNTCIYVHDDESQIDGEYIMTKFTLPLTHNGTMSITANKAPERII